MLSSWLQRLTNRAGDRARNVAVLVCCGLGVLLYLGVLARHYPLSAWLAWDLLCLWCWTALLNLAFCALGAWLFERAFETEPEDAFRALLFSAALGLTGFCLLLYAWGAVGGFRPWPLVGLCAGCVALGGRALWRVVVRLRAALSAQGPTGVGGWFATVAGGFAVALLYLQCLTPDAINFDANWYHLPIAQDYARQGRLVAFPGDYNRCFPHLASLIHTVGFSVPGLSAELRWMLALHVEFSIVLWKLFSALVGAQWMLGQAGPRGLWASFFLFPSIFVYDQNIGGSADHFMGFFAVPVFLALVSAWKNFDLRACCLLGALLGGAILTKYQALYVCAFSGSMFGARWVYCLARRLTAPRPRASQDPELRRLLLAAGSVALTALLVSSPHFLKNYVFYSNPVYPFAQGFFQSVPSHEKSKFWMDVAYANQEYLPKGEGLWKWLNALKLLFTFSFVPHYSFTKDFPAMGSLFTLLLPAVFFVRRPGKLAVGLLASCIGVFAWAMTYVGDRYLQGIISLPIAVTSALLVRIWELGTIARIGLVPLVALQIIWGADAFFYSGASRLQSAVKLITSGYEGRRSPSQRYPYRSMQKSITAATPPDAVLMVRNYRMLLGIDRTTLSDVEAWQSLFYYEPLRGPRALYDLYERRGVTHLLYPPGDRPQGTLQASILFDELVFRFCPERRRFGELELVTLPELPPPPDSTEPFRVLTLGDTGYAPGWYAIEQLNVYGRVPRHLRQFPAPELPYATRAGDQLTLELGRTRAVVIGQGHKRSRELEAALQRDFVSAERFKSFEIYLRKPVPGQVELNP